MTLGRFDRSVEEALDRASALVQCCPGSSVYPANGDRAAVVVPCIDKLFIKVSLMKCNQFHNLKSDDKYFVAYYM